MGRKGCTANGLADGVQRSEYSVQRAAGSVRRTTLSAVRRPLSALSACSVRRSAYSVRTLSAVRRPLSAVRRPLSAVRRPLSAVRPSGFRGDRRGVGGFFEEIPAFVVVVLSVSIFLVAAYTTYGRMGDDHEVSSLQEDCQRLCRAFRGYEKVLEKGPSSMEPICGAFEAGKLDALDYSTLQGALNSPHLYNLTVRDLLTGQNWSFGCPLPRGAGMKVATSSAAIVEDGTGRHDPARIEVVIWE